MNWQGVPIPTCCVICPKQLAWNSGKKCVRRGFSPASGWTWPFIACSPQAWTPALHHGCAYDHSLCGSAGAIAAAGPHPAFFVRRAGPADGRRKPCLRPAQVKYMVFNSLTFVVFFCGGAALAQSAASLGRKEIQSARGQLSVLCRVEPTVYPAVMGINGSGLASRPPDTPPGDAPAPQGMAHRLARSESGISWVFQVWQLRAGELACAHECRGCALPAAGVEHPAAGRNFVLHVPLDVLHTGHLLEARGTDPKLFDFALFVAFFTQLVAGPILRTFRPGAAVCPSADRNA